MPCMHTYPMPSRAPKGLTVEAVLRRVQIPKGFRLDPYLSLSVRDRTRLGVGREEAGSFTDRGSHNQNILCKKI